MGNNLKEIRKKIMSVQNTQKTTRAMKLVSSSKLRKAEEMARQSRLYAQKLNEIFEDIVNRLSVRGIDSVNSKYFIKSKNRKIKVVDIIVVTSDKGLCGGFNMMTIKEALAMRSKYLAEGVQVRIRAIGKKAVSYFQFNHIEMISKKIGLSSFPSYEKASEFVGEVMKDFLDDITDEVIILHNGFKNMLVQELKSQMIAPLCFQNAQTSSNSAQNITIEPDDEEDRVLEQLAQKFFEYNVYYALIDSLAAEHSARMQAMDMATNNASDLVHNLTILYNKARQETITTELVEINAGVEAMR